MPENGLVCGGQNELMTCTSTISGLSIIHI